MKSELPPLPYTPPPSGDVEHFRLALKRTLARTNEENQFRELRFIGHFWQRRETELERLLLGQRETFSDRYPLMEYISSESCDTCAGAPDEEKEPRSADDIDNNEEVNL